MQTKTKTKVIFIKIITIYNGKQSDQTDNNFNRKLQKFPYRRHDLQATHLTAGDIRTLIVEKEAILEDQQDIFSELNQELDKLLDEEVLGGTGDGSIHPTSCKLQTGDQDITLAGGLDNFAPGSFLLQMVVKAIARLEL